MAVQVIREPGIGENLGTAIGSGLNQGLQQLAQHKLQQIQQRQQQAQYQDALRKLAPNLPPQLVQGLSQLPPKQQELALQNLGSLLSGQQQQPQQQQGEFGPELGLAQGGNVEQNTNQNVANLFKNPQDRRAENKLDFQKEQAAETNKYRNQRLNVQERQQAYKIVKPELEKLRSVGERSKKDINTLNQLKALNRSGKLVQGKQHQILAKVGLQNFFTNPETELANKLSTQLGTGAASAFNTSRLTNFEVQSYQKTLPTLMNTKEGFEAIVKNRVLESKAEIAKADAARSIIKEHLEKGQAVPLNILDLAGEKAQPKLKEYADKAKKNLDEAMKNEWKVGSTHDEFPPDDPSIFKKGETVEDTQTGKVVGIFNGQQWERV